MKNIHLALEALAREKTQAMVKSAVGSRLHTILFARAMCRYFTLNNTVHDGSPSWTDVKDFFLLIGRCCDVVDIEERMRRGTRETSEKVHADI